MKKAYLFIYSNKVGTRDEVRNVIETIPEILAWRFDIPNSFYLVSEEDADTLADILLERFGKDGLFLVTEISENKQGWLPKRSWHLINNKRLPPKE